MITIVLTGLVVVGLMAGIRTLIVSSSVVYNSAQLETVLVNAADRIERAPQLCEYEDYVDAAALANGWPASTTTASVERLKDVTTGNPATDWEDQPCPDDVQPFDVQRLVITATTPDGEITRTMLVIKSDAE
ncbi:MAG: hypothetical protein QNJ12_15750 [Ilumatobacter sp.]|uniref:hypothetical protein n=1 Tax=Ilumatobacter sp. TaxID=1967498 RepID=UPI002612BCF8|nr:hypothetical protein [Ilumatobacter sp.]MDJ0770255.1 hypothetical protein [Ilumatobacter sp.]